MIIKIGNEQIAFDNSKITVIYTDNNNVSNSAIESSRIGQALALTIKAKDFNSKYLSEIWENELKNLAIEDGNVVVQFLDNDKNSEIVLNNIGTLDYQINFNNNVIEETIHFYHD